MKEEILKMPKLGMTMESGTIMEIHGKPGGFVKEGEVIMSFETEKLNEEITAPFDGYIKKILVEKDQDVKVGEELLVFSDEM